MPAKVMLIGVAIGVLLVPMVLFSSRIGGDEWPDVKLVEKRSVRSGSAFVLAMPSGGEATISTDTTGGSTRSIYSASSSTWRRLAPIVPPSREWRVYLPLVTKAPEPARTTLISPWGESTTIYHTFGSERFWRELPNIAWCESRFSPAALSYTGDWGLLQLNRFYQEDRVNALGYEWEQVLDPEVNVRVAWDIYQETGWQRWACRDAALLPANEGHD